MLVRSGCYLHQFYITMPMRSLNSDADWPFILNFKQISCSNHTFHIVCYTLIVHEYRVAILMQNWHVHWNHLINFLQILPPFWDRYSKYLRHTSKNATYDHQIFTLLYICHLYCNTVYIWKTREAICLYIRFRMESIRTWIIVKTLKFLQWMGKIPDLEEMINKNAPK